MNRDQKAAVIDEVAAQISEAEAVFAVDYRGISVPQAAELRTKLRDADATLPGRQEHPDRAGRRQGGRRCAQGAARGPDRDDVRARRRRGGRQGAVGLPPRQRRHAARVQGRLDERRRRSAPPEIEAIAKLPSRDVLYGRLVGMVASPLTGLVTSLGRPDRRPRPPAAGDRRPGPGQRRGAGAGRGGRGACGGGRGARGRGARGRGRTRAGGRSACGRGDPFRH